MTTVLLFLQKYNLIVKPEYTVDDATKIEKRKGSLYQVLLSV